MIFTEAQKVRKRYEKIGLDVIPVSPVVVDGKKPPLCGGWQDKEPLDLWSQVKGQNCNVAIRWGKTQQDGMIVAADADDSKSEAVLGHYLEGLGINAPYWRTPLKNGVQFVVKINDVPDSISVRPWLSSIGKGEFRARKCYSVCPESAYEGKPYLWERGNIQDVLNLQPISYIDLLPLFADIPQKIITKPPFTLIKLNTPKMTYGLLKELDGAHKGQSFDLNNRHYVSRNEAETRVVWDMVVTGHMLDDILREFEFWKPSKYMEQKSRSLYLEKKYYVALGRLKEQRKSYELLYYYADSLEMNHRGKELDKETLKAICVLGWQFGISNPFCDQRTLGHYLGYTQQAIAKSTARLERMGLIKVTPGISWAEGSGLATIYDLTPLLLSSSISLPEPALFRKEFPF
jgi:hypothetical protein